MTTVPDHNSSVAHERVGPPLAIAEELFADLSAIAADEGCALLHVGRSGSALQLVLDHPEGVTHEHCSRVSRQAGAVLDALDYGAGRYVLEVTSPGLDREFYTVGDYEEHVGSQVKVVHRSDGRKHTTRGLLLGFAVDRREITVADSARGANAEQEPLTIKLEDVQSTRLEVVL